MHRFMSNGIKGDRLKRRIQPARENRNWQIANSTRARKKTVYSIQRKAAKAC